MIRSLVNTLKPEDYPDIQQGVQICRNTVMGLRQRGGRIEIGHDHRFWEWGTAVQLMIDTYHEAITNIEVLDVGAGFGVLGPALNWFWNTKVTEYEPSQEEFKARKHLNTILQQNGKSGINIYDVPMETMPQGDGFDVVCCVSVLEHVNPEYEKDFWKKLGALVVPGGIFYVTVDCVEKKGVAYQMDHLRTQNFTTDDVRERLEMMQKEGFTLMTEPDYEYHGHFVNGYTFFRAAMKKDGLDVQKSN